MTSLLQVYDALDDDQTVSCICLLCMFPCVAKIVLVKCKIQTIFKHLSWVHPVLVYILVYTVYILPILCNSSFFFAPV